MNASDDDVAGHMGVQKTYDRVFFWVSVKKGYICFHKVLSHLPADR